MRKVKIKNTKNRVYADTGNKVKQGDICWIVEIPKLSEIHFFEYEENAKDFNEIINL